eukprot:6491290-Amphidinium_carterae.3
MSVPNVPGWITATYVVARTAGGHILRHYVTGPSTGNQAPCGRRQKAYSVCETTSGRRIYRRVLTKEGLLSSAGKASHDLTRASMPQVAAPARDLDEELKAGKMGSELDKGGVPPMTTEARDIRETLGPTPGCPAVP